MKSFSQGPFPVRFFTVNLESFQRKSFLPVFFRGLCSDALKAYAGFQEAHLLVLLCEVGIVMLISRRLSQHHVLSSPPVDILSDAWRCRVIAWTGWSGVIMLALDEITGSICNFYLRA